MDLLQQAQALIGSQYAPLFTATVTVLSLVPKLIAPLLSAFEAHDKHFVRKPLERLKALRSSVAKNPDLSHYLETSIELEAFRIASGVTTSRSKMDFLLALDKDGNWTKSQLRSLCRHLEVPDGRDKPEIVIGAFEKFAAIWSAVAAMTIGIMGALYFTVSVYQFDLYDFTLGASAFAASIAFGRFVVSDFISYRLALRAQATLARRQRPS
ncbi:hypothetical protein FIV02_18420 [Pseudomonas sp. THAF187a]|uniref:hypothetical protein n=1 Tax=unclassified Pseudomonas TaxID=196821 RepID=UPI00126819D6|nr:MULTISPECIES: hypothetical protein [unclassified Pseudomonas]QFT23552.1 hypothetical protein FIV02_18420 [Pseudomonas sp. THAF187a]QFT43740.1 hypothetical protein FIU98_18405 [Pseudomonas sp. THAF42]